jgi:ATP-dependent Clp protease ATP-binding subunit ClpA
MTTNAGAREMNAKSMGFDSGKATVNAGVRGKDAIERTFAPEFRNRLDAWIGFESLPKPIILQVVDKLVKELVNQLVEKKVMLQLTDEAREWLADHGFDPQFGARPMARLIQNELKKGLADEILFGRLKNGGKVRATVENDKLKLDVV